MAHNINKWMNKTLTKFKLQCVPKSLTTDANHSAKFAAKESQPNMKIRNGLLVPLLLLTTVAISGCVTNTLDLAGRGSVTIPAKVLVDMREKGMSANDPVLIRIFKKESELELWKRDKTGKYALLRTYPMCRWSGQLGPKKAEGDRQAPEGFYEVNYSRLNPNSEFYLSFNLGFPNKLERAKGYTGSALMVHGACTSSGCFAISDEYVAELYPIVRDALKGGQTAFQVQSYPFRMEPDNLAAYRDNPNFNFWLDLKKGYDHFQVTRKPPQFNFCEGRYRFGSLSEGELPASAMGTCPTFAPEPALVAAKTVNDLNKVAEIVNQGSAKTYAYSDGGMHPTYRSILFEKGADFLSRSTSWTKVPISRPKAALSDPFTPK
jgi:murein L,D-transpeptidase YafK